MLAGVDEATGEAGFPSIDAVDGKLGTGDEGAAQADSDEDAGSEDVYNEACVARRRGQPDQSAGENDQRADEGAFGTECADDVRGYGGDDYDRSGQGQLREARGECVVAEHRLHVDGEREEQGDHRGADEKHYEVACAEVAVAEHHQGHERF